MSKMYTYSIGHCASRLGADEEDLATGKILLQTNAVSIVISGCYNELAQQKSVHTTSHHAHLYPFVMESPRR